MPAAPIGPYSPVVRAGDFLIVSGQVGKTEDGQLADGISAQTTHAMRNIAEYLASAGAGLEDVFKTTIYLDDVNDFAEMNEAYAEALGETRPARATVGVEELPGGPGVLVEIEAWAYKPE